MADAHFVLLENRSVLAVSGPDRRSFLQGLVSNNVEKVDATQARYAALLTAQGKYLHDFIMVGVSDALWLDAEADRVADLERRLSIYRLRAKTALERRTDLAVLVIFGTAALALLDLPAAPGTARLSGGGTIFVDPRLAVLGARAILPRATARTALTDAGLDETDFGEYERMRLGQGVADGSRDLVPEKSILLESGFDELNGIDWLKGCYIGQELTARTKYRGLVRRRLMPVAIEGPAPAPGTIVVADGREVGEMRSSCADLGLALLRIEVVLEGTRLTAGGATVVPQRPGWMRLPAETDE